MNKKVALGFVVLGVIALYFLLQNNSEKTSPNEQIEVKNKSSVSIIKTNLYVPWSVDFLPNGDLVVTERNGRLQIIGKSTLTLKIPDVVEIGEGGLLGLAIHPDFNSNKYIYLYFTTRSGDKIINRVSRYFFDGTSLTQNKVVLDNIPGGQIHNGGRIAFGPDKMLYITTGDSGKENLAQDKTSLAGKVLRVREDGSIPEDNPFQNEVYSYGHRNPQGIAWDNTGNLWESEHGRSGIQSGLDEINLIKIGGNYGWPIIEGNEERDGMEKPRLHSGSSDTWAPSGLAIKENKIYFVGLRGQTLYSTEILQDGELGEVKERFKNEYGRLRGLTLGLDGALYITTSNRDGRGKVLEGDDKLLKLQEN